MERLGYMDVVKALSTTERERYSRQTMLSEVGEEGQMRLKSSSALVVGAGGLGAPLLYYLAAAGVGRIGIVDYDCVSQSNLQRQILFVEEDLGLNKAEQAVIRLSKLNSLAQLDVYPIRFDKDSAMTVAQGYDIIIDATDNLQTRYLLDEVSSSLDKPYLYGAVDGFVGQSSLFNTGNAGRYRDLFPSFDQEADSRPIGVLGATAGVLGSIMATEAIKVLLGKKSSLAGFLLRFDLSQMDFVRIQLS